MDGQPGPRLAGTGAIRSFPPFTKAVGAFDDGYDLRLDVLFTSGLKALLDGPAPLIEGQETVT
ncbi:hypothetical protein ACWD01_37305 [Streptomyces sp. NPDC002835]